MDGSVSLHKKITVLIPVFNEEKILEDSVNRVMEQLEAQKRYDWEILIVDDGSGDETYSIAEKISGRNGRVFTCRHRENSGLGKTTRTGFAHASGDIIVTLDADLSYRPQYILILVDALVDNSADISIASPYSVGGKVINVPWHRHALSRYGNMYMAWFTGYGISTLTSMVRAYRRDAVIDLPLYSDGAEFQLEVLIRAHAAGLRVVEVPATLEWSSAIRKPGLSRKRAGTALPKTLIAYLSLLWFNKPQSQRK
ncbi:MAG: glycosyltransferase [Candidatus Xenobiia bacterium LiM19]